MRTRPITWFLLSLASFLAAMFFWQLGEDRRHRPTVPAAPAPAKTAAQPQGWGTPFNLLTRSDLVANPTVRADTVKRSPSAYVLKNTTKTPAQLARYGKAILLQNALIDTATRKRVEIPAHLALGEKAGSYVVQTRDRVGPEFRDALQKAGAEIIGYVPNDAYLVRADAAVADQIRRLRDITAVLPFEPYFKLDAALLPTAVEQESLPAGRLLRVAFFPSVPFEEAKSAVEGLVAGVAGVDRTPFGNQLIVRANPDSLVALARLPIVEGIERVNGRALLNDLSRVQVGVSTNGSTTLDWGGLTGTNVFVVLADDAVDGTHLDLGTNRVFPGNFENVTNDTAGHGTFVAGIIASSGAHSPANPTAGGLFIPGSVTNANYRGIAPGANLLFLDFSRLDTDLQETAALSNLVVFAKTNTLIVNNSWHSTADSTYGFIAASYDAAARDAVPHVSGSQPVLYINAAGDVGGGDTAGQGGISSSVTEPANMKNGIAVGQLEAYRRVTNVVVRADGAGGWTTNAEFFDITDSSNQVMNASGRGNIDSPLDGQYGRFSPDLVAGGTMQISTRSPSWDTNAYYNPVEVNSFSFDWFMGANTTSSFLLNLPWNATNLSVQASFLSTPVLPLLFFTNQVAGVAPSSVALDYAGIGGFSTALSSNNFGIWYYDVANTNNSDVTIHITEDVWITDNKAAYYRALSNLNENFVAPYYRFEPSGTSFAAPVVSGLAALIEEFFEQKLPPALQRRLSPAAIKAMLINGARPVSDSYTFATQDTLNIQGWGVPNITNIITTNMLINATPSQWQSQVFDQDPTNALATGESHLRHVTVGTAGVGKPMRVTLVWTDPAANPFVDLKLVNDLDLIVTNLDSGEVYVGNLFQSSVFSQVADFSTNSFDSLRDIANNVENVYIESAGTNYTVTVVAHRVNVNAVTTHTNAIVQDYALVISTDDRTDPSPLTIDQTPTWLIDTNAVITYLTNSTNNVVLNQRVGANSPLLYDNNGTPYQWRFYVLTNTLGGNFTNAAFVTFLPPNLSVSIAGDPYFPTPRNISADIDLYVSVNDPTITNLNPTAIQNSYKSLSRGGNEVVAFTNSALNDVYYVGVKSEDQRGADFGFAAIITDQAFNARDTNGALLVFGIPLPADIPDGLPDQPGGVRVLGIALESIQIQNVVVTNTISHEDFGDLSVFLEHNTNFVYLHNHTTPTDPGIGTNTIAYVYDDTGRTTNSQPTDGPGSLTGFVGDDGIGLWLLTVEDNALNHTGQVNNLIIRLEPQSIADNSNGGTHNSIDAGQSLLTFVDVPPEAVSLSINFSQLTSGPLDVYMRYQAVPTTNTYDHYAQIAVPGGALTITSGSVPPLRPGRYYILIVNNTSATADFFLSFTMTLDYAATAPTKIPNLNPVSVSDDTFTNGIFNAINVSTHSLVAKVGVGVRIQHSRASDLVVMVRSPRPFPDGTRVILSEARGFTSMWGYGDATNTQDLAYTLFNENTNVPVPLMGSNWVQLPVFVPPVPKPIKQAVESNFMNFIPPRLEASTFMTDTNWTVSTNGTTGNNLEARALIPTGTNAGQILVNWDFYQAPDQMQILQDGVVIYDTGSTNNAVGDSTFNAQTGVDPVTDTITTLAPHGFTNDTPVGMFTANGINGLAANVKYYVQVVSATQLQLSLTPGGPVVDITAAGANTVTTLFPYYTFTVAYSGTSPIIEIAMNPGSASSGTAWKYDFALLDSAGVAYSYVGSNSVQRAKSIAITGNDLYLAGMTEAFVTNGLIARFGLPLQDNALPIYSLDWPNNQGGTDFGGISAGSDGVYAVGQSYNFTTDLINGKQTKGITVKFPLDVPQQNALNPQGQIWYQQVPTNDVAPGAFAYAGRETLLATATLDENGVQYVYVVGEGQADANNFSRLMISKLDTSGNIMWTTNDADLMIGDTNSSAHAVVARGTNLYVAGFTADPSGITNAYLVCYDTNGTRIWTTTLGIESRFNGLAIYGDALYAVGAANADSGPAADALLAKFDLSGALVWSQVYDLNSAGTEDVLNGVVAYADRLYAVGSTALNGTGRDILILEADQVGGGLITNPGYSYNGYTTLDFTGQDDVAYGAAMDGNDLYIVGEGRRYDSTVRTDADAVLLRFRIKNNYLPEEQLSLFNGQDPSGDWKLEVWDTRSGGTNETPVVLGWQLYLQTAASATQTSPIHLTSNTTNFFTTTLYTNQVMYFLIDAPYAATQVYHGLTNLNTTGGGLNLSFNQTQTPGFGVPGSYTLLANVPAASGQANILTANTTPGVIFGQRYYLAVSNNVPTETNTFTLDVAFNSLATTYLVANHAGSGTFQANRFNSFANTYQFPVYPSYPYVTLQLTNVSGNVNVLARLGAQPAEDKYDFSLSLSGTNAGSLVIQPTNGVPSIGGTWFVTVTDPGSGTATYDIAVYYPNTAPFFLPVAAQTIDEDATLKFTVKAKDNDAIKDSLVYTLDPGAPAGMTITSTPTNAVITWSPTEADGPATYTVTVRVTDNGAPPLSQTIDVPITVNEVNRAPSITAPGSKTVNEGTLLSFTVGATDPDIPANTLSFSLDPGAPSGASINPTSGVFSWTPTESQGPGTYIIAVRVTDNGTPSLSDVKSFSVTVNEVNLPPVIGSIADKTVIEGTLLNFSLPVTDPDIPANSLSFALISAPVGTTVHPTLGSFAWTPPQVSGTTQYDIQFRVTDNGVPPLSSTGSFRVFVINTNTAPSIPNIGTKIVTEEQLLSFVVNATDSDLPADTLTYSLTNAPAGATIGAGTGAFSWTPTEAQGPSTNLMTVIVTDNGVPPKRSTRDFTVIVNESNRPPVLAAVLDQVVNELTALVVTNRATDPDIPTNTLTFALASAPTGASINSSSGVFTWSPTELQGPGVYTISVMVTDNGTPPLSATNSFQVTVNEVNTAPVMATVPDKTVTESTLLSFTISAVDSDRPVNNLSWSFDGTVPTGLTIAAVNASTAQVTWTPTEAQGPGVYTVTARVTDDGVPPLSNTRTFTITVNETNSAPVITTIADQTINELEAFTQTVTATDNDVPAQTLTYSLLSPPTGMTIGTSSGVINWTPTEAQGPSTNTIKVKVTDNGTPALSATNSFTIIVKEINSAPALTVQTNRSVNELTTLVVTNTATDADLPAQKLAWTLLNPPAGAVINSTNGILTWTPTEAQGPGTYTVTVVVTDDGSPALSATNSYSVTVNEVNVAPVLPTVGTLTVVEGQLLSADLHGTDADIPANTLAYEVLTAPTGVQIDAATGLLTWTPTEAQGPGTYTVKVKVTDNGVPPLSATNSYTVSVLETNSAPQIATILNQVVNEGSTMNVTVSATDPDVPANAITLALVSAPSGVTFNPTTKIISWTPTEAQGPGTYTISVSATDNGSPALSSTNSFQVTVNEVNQAPTINTISNKTVIEGTLLSFTITGADADLPANTLTWTLVDPVPAGAAINATSGLFTWTPSESQGGAVHTINVRLTDNGTPALSATNSFNVTVTKTNSAPVFDTIADQFASLCSPLTFLVTASDSDLPANTLLFVPGANTPSGLTINPTNGLVTWNEPGPVGTNVFSVIVRDNGSPSLSATQSVRVIVTGATPVTNILANAVGTNGITRTCSPFSLVYQFTVPGGTTRTLYEVYGLTGDADLFVRKGQPPTTNTFDYLSSSLGTTNEQVVARTNASLTDLGGDWYVVVAGRTNVLVGFSVRATVPVEADGGTLLLSGTPLTLQAAPVVSTGGNPKITWPTVQGEKYEVEVSTNLVDWTVLTTFVADGTTGSFTDPSVLTSSTYRFYRIRQVPQ